MPNVTVTLDETEQLELEEILLDDNEKAALEFLKRAVRSKVKERLTSHCLRKLQGPC